MWKIILILCALSWADIPWTAQRYAEHGDTCFVYRDSVYSAGEYYQLDGQKYLWSSSPAGAHSIPELRDTPFDLIDIFDVRVSQSCAGLSKPHKYFDLENSLIDTINTWGLYHKDVELAMTRGLLGTKVTSATYYDSFLVVELPLLDDAWFSTVRGAITLCAGIITHLYHRIDRNLFDDFVRQQVGNGYFLTYLDRSEYFPNGSGEKFIALFSAQIYTPVSVFACLDQKKIIAIIPTVHPMTRIGGSPDPHNLIGHSMDFHHVVIEPTQTGKEIRKMTHADILRIRPKKHDGDVNEWKEYPKQKEINSENQLFRYLKDKGFL